MAGLYEIESGKSRWVPNIQFSQPKRSLPPIQEAFAALGNSDPQNLKLLLHQNLLIQNYLLHFPL